VWELHERDGQSPVSRDLCARVSLLHRTTHDGRGALDGWWLSPLAPSDLLCALDSVLAAQQQGMSGGQRWADYELPAAWCANAALGGTQLQRRTLRQAGYGRELARIRVTVEPAPAGSAFSIQGFEGGAAVGSLSRQNPVLLADVFGMLLDIEQRALLRRILGGWRVPMPELLSQPVDQLTAALALAIPGAQLAAVGLG
jgi:hypothetical protein